MAQRLLWAAIAASLLSTTAWADHVSSNREPVKLPLTPDRLKSSAPVVPATVDVAVKTLPMGVDPVITGVRVSKHHLKKWKAQREAYRKCPTCFDQPYPSDGDVFE